MHRFVLHATGHQLAPHPPGAHLLGTDGVPIRGQISVAEGHILAETRSQDPLALSLLWPVKGYGQVQLETTRLPVREAPFHLHVELARHRLMRILNKREEWGLFDYPGMDDIAALVDQARDAFIQALEQADDVPAAANLADRSLTLSVEAAERLCRFHANVFLGRRQQAGGFGKPFLGAPLPPAAKAATLTSAALEAFDHFRLPLVWRQVQPKEQSAVFDGADELVKAAAKAKIPLRAGPLLNFGVQSVPDWMYIWENDYESILEYARDHVRRTVQRYANQVGTWIVASGLHAESVFPFTFEQIMDLTRMAASVTKQIAPRSAVVLELTQPWGEYYARNPRTVPPMLYADMIVQSGIPFDAFGVQFVFGLGADGFFLRDLFQLSAMIDRLANFGKPLHVTGLAVPSAAKTGEPAGGQWHAAWTDQLQADWLQAACEIALSKPYVESVCLQTFADGANEILPTGGALREDLTPKPALARLATLRKRLLGGG